MQAVDDDARAEEQQGLEERVGEQVEDARRHQAPTPRARNM